MAPSCELPPPASVTPRRSKLQHGAEYSWISEPSWKGAPASIHASTATTPTPLRSSQTAGKRTRPAQLTLELPSTAPGAVDIEREISSPASPVAPFGLSTSSPKATACVTKTAPSSSQKLHPMALSASHLPPPPSQGKLGGTKWATPSKTGGAAAARGGASPTSMLESRALMQSYVDEDMGVYTASPTAAPALLQAATPPRSGIPPLLSPSTHLATRRFGLKAAVLMPTGQAVDPGVVLSSMGSPLRSPRGGGGRIGGGLPSRSSSPAQRFAGDGRTSARARAARRLQAELRF
jgi:hypothetical protein